MKSSESISKLAPALVAANGELQAVTKDRENSHFKNSYATLDAIVAYVRPILAKHGLAIVQGASTPHSNDDGRVAAFVVETRIVHTSGEWIEGGAVMPLAKADPQGAGAALTYGRRYGLSALLSLATDDDDDGNSASVTPSHAAVRTVAPRAAAPAKSAPAAAVPNCPKCDGPMWDNRADNVKRIAEGKKARPSFGCKDRTNCDGVVWSDSGVDEARDGAPRQLRRESAPPPPPILPEYEDEMEMPF